MLRHLTDFCSSYKSTFEVGEVAEGLRDAWRDVLVVFNLADVGNLDAMNLCKPTM